jgi:formyl-CoA transferase
MATVSPSPVGANAGALAGFRVLELGTLIAGPFAGRILADFGAEVIKIEAPGRPDPLREWGQGRYRGRGLWWPVQSRNKKLVTLDLSRGQNLFLQLVEKSDVVLENFRPGTLERWGLGYDRIRSVNPRLVVVRVSGYGQTGPLADRPGYASVAEAVSGLRSLNGYPDQPPPRSGISLGDSLAALFAVIGALVALLARRGSRGGSGQVVDVSLVESCLAMLESVIPEYDRLGLVRQPSGTRLEGIAPSNIFPTRDGRWMIIAANQDAVFRRLCAAMGQPELADDPRFIDHVARGENQDLIDGILAAWAATLDAAELEDLLNEAGVVCGPVNTVAEVVRDRQLGARDAIVAHHDEELGEFLGPGIVPRLSGTPGEIRWTGPWLPGAHNNEVFGEMLRVPADELEQLKVEGVI